MLAVIMRVGSRVEYRPPRMSISSRTQGVHQRVLLTAVVYFKRMSVGLPTPATSTRPAPRGFFEHNDRRLVALTCIHLASKVEEVALPLPDLIKYVSTTYGNGAVGL
jgi:hypothetical protein